MDTHRHLMLSIPHVRTFLTYAVRIVSSLRWLRLRGEHVETERDARKPVLCQLDNAVGRTDRLRLARLRLAVSLISGNANDEIVSVLGNGAIFHDDTPY